MSAVKLDSSVTTAIHNAAHAVITSAAIGATVDDSATLTGPEAGGTPCGPVTFTVYSSSDCTTGGVAGTPVALSGGVADPSQTAVQTAGGISFSAHYNEIGRASCRERVWIEEVSPVKHE